MYQIDSPPPEFSPEPLQGPDASKQLLPPPPVSLSGSEALRKPPFRVYCGKMNGDISMCPPVFSGLLEAVPGVSNVGARIQHAEAGIVTALAVNPISHPFLP